MARAEWEYSGWLTDARIVFKMTYSRKYFGKKYTSTKPMPHVFMVAFHRLKENGVLQESPFQQIEFPSH